MPSRSMGIRLLAGLLLAGLAAPAGAETQLVLGKLLLVRDLAPGVDPARRRITVIGAEENDDLTVVGDPTDPTTGGATVEMVANGGLFNQTEVYPMPAAGWRRIPINPDRPLIGYRYRDSRPGRYGPVWNAVIRKQSNRFLLRVRVVGTNGPGPQPHVAIVPPNPGTDGGMSLTILNGDTYCVTLGGEAGGRVLNRPALAPSNRLFRVTRTPTAPTQLAGCVQGHCPLSGGALGSCCEAQSGAACADVDCCHRVSEQEHMCGSSFWSPDCAATAAVVCTVCGGTPDVCGNGYIEGGEECDPPDGLSCAPDCTALPPSCGSGVESCCEGHDSPACTDQSCCALVCESDPRCCWFGWDASCADAAAALCGGACPTERCPAVGASCCEGHAGGSCNDVGCCEAVCDVDSSCCNGSWDSACAAFAGQICSTCNAPVCPSDGQCFEAHANPGCNQKGCCEDVCTLLPSCCTSGWTAQCAQVAAANCNPTPFVGRIDIEVNNTADQADDYLTWGPTIARIRVALREAAGDLTVVLTNSVANGVGGHGRLQFDTYAKAPDQWPTDWPADKTAEQETITLTLPRNEAWVPFVVTGQFTGLTAFPSRGIDGVKGRDTIIEVRDGAANGPVLGTHDVMVRVRKNVANLSKAERDRLVNTLKALRTAKEYQVLQDMHREGFQFGPADDFIHDNPAFLTWHRAMLLHLERKLQAVDPAVTVPYWDSDTDVPATLFTEEFLGKLDPANCPPPPAGSGIPPGCLLTAASAFGPANWTVNVGAAAVPIRRADHAFTGDPTKKENGANNSGPVQLEASGFATGKANYPSMREAVEEKIHNLAHAWVGGLNNRMGLTVIDPIFFLYHSNHDRIWADWQRTHPGFATAVEYSPDRRTFDPAKTITRMAYLDETLWPWNGKKNGGAFPGGWPGTIPGGAGFPPSPAGDKLGPKATPGPLAKEMIDYLGRTKPTDALGFCYESVKFK